MAWRQSLTTEGKGSGRGQSLGPLQAKDRSIISWPNNNGQVVQEVYLGEGHRFSKVKRGNRMVLGEEEKKVLQDPITIPSRDFSSASLISQPLFTPAAPSLQIQWRCLTLRT